MDNRKRPRRLPQKRSTNAKTTRRKPRKKVSVLKTNCIILGVIFGASAMLLAGRFLFAPALLSVEPVPVERPAEPSVKPPEKTPEPITPGAADKPVEKPSVEPVEKPRDKPVVTVPVSPDEPAAPRAPPPEKPVPAEPKGTLVFVFDDAGYNLVQLQPFLDLPFPCTIAVLPGLRYSAEAARRIRKAGKECILHQPMQAVNLSSNPGPGAILPGMSPDEIRAVVRANIAEVAPVVGINNHEGSLITADRTAMNAVLDVVADSGLFFLDSRTTAETVVPVLARERNMRIWERAVFLDNSQDRDTIIDAVYNGMKIAERRGSAIMIGHIWSNELAQILTEMYPEMVSQGFSLSTIAKLAASGEGDE